MKFEKIKNKGQARLFESRYLEMLTKTHPLIIWGMYIPIMGYMLYYSYDTVGNSLGRIGLIFAGALFSGRSLNTSCTVSSSTWCPTAPCGSGSFTCCMATTTNTRETSSGFLCRRCPAFYCPPRYSPSCTS